MTNRIIIDPITRMNGNLAIDLTLKDGVIANAFCMSNVYVGAENTLIGKYPIEAIQITQRINGLNSIAHGVASVNCLEQLSAIKLTKNGRLLRNLLLAAEFLHLHIMHFYHLALFDYINVYALRQYTGSDSSLVNLKKWLVSDAVSGSTGGKSLHSGSIFLHRRELNIADANYLQEPALNIELVSGYVKACAMLIKLQTMTALLGGRAPHALTLVPGGVSFNPEKKRIKIFKGLLHEVEQFVKKVYIPHVSLLANEFRDYFKMGLYNNMLSYGGFEFGSAGKKRLFQSGVYINAKPGPFDGKGIQSHLDHAKVEKHEAFSRFAPGVKTVVDPLKANAYSWAKALRYAGSPMEVGPLARITVSYLSDKTGSSDVKAVVDLFIQKLNIDISALFSVQGRHIARAIECKLLCAKAHEWLAELNFDKKSQEQKPYDFYEKGVASVSMESAQGSISHRAEINTKKIRNYQCTTPLDWFWSPRDNKNMPGPVEEVLLGTAVKDARNPLEIMRIIRSF